MPLLEAYRKEGGGDWVQGVWEECQALLKEGETLEAILETVGAYQQNPVMQSFYNFEAWPMQNSPEQVEMTVGTSADIVALHKNRKELVSDVLSAHVVSATGALIFGASSNADGPVLWLDHDLVAQQLIAANS